MKKLIHRYLNENYGWKYDALILLQPKEFANFRNVIKDLNTVFNLTRKQTKWYIKSWVRKTNSRVDFNTLWRNAIFILKATWSPEMAQDISAFHGIDAEAELTAMLSEQMAQEIDRLILNRILNFENEQ